MDPFTPRQLVLLLGLLAAALAGIGIGRWRAGHPDLVDRLEQWDRAGARVDRSTGPPADAGEPGDSLDPERRAADPGSGPMAAPAPGAVADPSRPGAAAGRSEAPARAPEASRAARHVRARPEPEEGPRPLAVKLPSAPTGEPPPGPLDLNRAGLDELMRLPGVGPALAARILAARESTGGFASVDDLLRVRGLGRSRLERLRPLVVVGE